MSEEKAPPRLWLPQHWPAWCAVAVLRVLALLPLPVLLAVGRVLGAFVYHVLRIRRGVTEKNLELCFPELAPAARGCLAARSYASFGMGLFEAVYSYFRGNDSFAGRFTLEGLEHVEAARQAGRGVLLMSAHFHTLEVAGRIMLMHLPLSAFYRNPNNPVFARMLHRSRAPLLKRMFHVRDVKNAIRALREGDLLWYAPDQGKRIKDAVIAPFFGVPALTNAATGKVAALGRALIIPWSTVRERRDGRWHYRVTIHPPMPELPEDPVAEATAVNAVIERMVRAAPEQYLWQHKRFKYRGDAFPDVYAGLR